MIRFRFMVAACLCLAVAACGSVPLPQHQPSIEAIQALRTSGIVPLKVGTFARDPKMSAQQDKSITSRSVTVTSPDDGSFAVYLGNVLKTDLDSAGKLYPNSTSVVEGLLNVNELSTGIGMGTGSLGAHFTLTRNGAVVFDKNLVVQQQWDGNFIGAVAIPEAINHYQSMYKELIDKLLSDEEFLKAAL